LARWRRSLRDPRRHVIMCEAFMSTTTFPPASRADLRIQALNSWEFWGRMLVLPYLLVFVVFVLYPVGYGLWLARDPDSYVKLAADPIFFRTAINTIVFLVVAINVKMVVALGLSGFFVQSALVDQDPAVLFILPWAVPSASRPSCRCASCSTPSGA
jgi:multiple sugar transport system permease protein